MSSSSFTSGPLFLLSAKSNRSNEVVKRRDEVRPKRESVRGNVIERSNDHRKARLTTLPRKAAKKFRRGTAGRFPEHEGRCAQMLRLSGGRAEERRQVFPGGVAAEEVRDEGRLPGDRQDRPSRHLSPALRPNHAVPPRRTRMESPVCAGAVPYRGVGQEARRRIPQRIETLPDGVRRGGGLTGRREGPARHVKLSDREESSRTHDRVTDLERARIGKAETERDPSRADLFVESFRHRAVDSPPAADPANGGIGCDVADGVTERRTAIEKHPRPPTGVVADDLASDERDDPEPPVGVSVEFPRPLLRGELPPEDPSEEPPDAGRIRGGRLPNEKAAHSFSQTNVCSGRPSDARKARR